MNGQTWESMTPEQQHAEWLRFQAWQRHNEARADLERFQQRQPSPLSAPVAGPRHVQLGTPTARRVLLVAVIAVLIALGMLASNANSTTTISGAMTVVSNTSGATYPSTGSSAGTCTTYGGYDDIVEGVSVTIRDATGAIAGVGRLETGQGGSYGCVFPFTVDDVPASEFYTVEISHRGQVTFTADDVRNDGVKLSLG